MPVMDMASYLGLGLTKAGKGSLERFAAVQRLGSRQKGRCVLLGVVDEKGSWSSSLLCKNSGRKTHGVNVAPGGLELHLGARVLDALHNFPWLKKDRGDE